MSLEFQECLYYYEMYINDKRKFSRIIKDLFFFNKRKYYDLVEWIYFII